MSVGNDFIETLLEDEPAKLARLVTRVIGRSCIGYEAELAPQVDITKPIVVIGVDHNTKTVTVGNAS